MTCILLGEDGDSSASTDSAPLDPDVEMDLEQQLDLNFKIIRKKYGAYVDCILNIVIKKGISVKQLSSYLLSIMALTKADDKENLQLLSDMEADLKGAKEIADIFISLNLKYASFLDYEIFEMILEYYGPGEEGEELTYPTHLKAYIEQHKIKEFIRLNPQLINPKLKKLDAGSKTIKIKLNISRTQNLATLKEVTKAVANILKIRASTLRLCGVKKGCVLVTLLIPASIAEAFFTSDTAFSSEQITKFRAAKVLWFKCNGFKFDFRKGKTSQPHDRAQGNVHRPPSPKAGLHY